MMVAALLLAALAPPATAGPTFGFGDVQVEVLRTPPKRETYHGYVEYAFLVTNAGSAVRQVTLVLPGREHYGRGEELRAVRRTVTVGPKDQSVVSLFQPAYPPVNAGQGVRVIIDGQVQEAELPVEIMNFSRPSGHVPSGVGIRGSGIGKPNPRSPTPDPRSPSHPPLILVGPTVRQDFLDRFEHGTFPLAPAGLPAGAGQGQPVPDPRPPTPAPRVSFPLETERPDGGISSWSTHWLGYSAYDGVILTAEDLAAASDSVRGALWRYVECGGVLLVLGEGTVDEGWQPTATRADEPGIYHPGFGLCIVAPMPDPRIPTPLAGLPADRSAEDRFVLAARAWSQTAGPLEQEVSTTRANRALPVVEDIGIPVRGLFVLMFAFAVVIGPVNVMLLARRGRRLWLLGTVPAISALTVLAVTGYLFVSEGWSRHVRTDVLTILDHRTGRATTIGWTGFYSPVTPGDGLHFGYETEATLQGASVSDDFTRSRRDRSGDRVCEIDWTGGQHLARGWVSARVPAYFQLRKSEARPERILVRRGKDGVYTVVNGLGSRITALWFADADGKIHSAGPIEPGGRATLTPTELRLRIADCGLQIEEKSKIQNPQSAIDGSAPARGLFTGNWFDIAKTVRDNRARYLRPLSYLVELEDSPFLEDGLRDAQERKCRSTVLGYHIEPEHER